MVFFFFIVEYDICESKTFFFLQMKTSRLYQHKAHLRRLRYVLAVQPCQQIIADLRRTTAFPVFPWISTQQYSPAYLAEDKSREFLNVVVAFAILETVFMILFFTSRAMNKTSNGWDVYLMIPGYIFCFGHIVVASCMFKASLQDTEMR